MLIARPGLLLCLRLAALLAGWPVRPCRDLVDVTAHIKRLIGPRRRSAGAAVLSCGADVFGEGIVDSVFAPYLDVAEYRPGRQLDVVNIGTERHAVLVVYCVRE